MFIVIQITTTGITTNVYVFMKRPLRDCNEEEVQKSVKTVQRVLKGKIREAKDTYRRKLENKLHQNIISEVYCVMKTITSFKLSSRGVNRHGQG